MYPRYFRISASSLSKRFKRTAVAHLEELQIRRLDNYDFAAVFVDGKRCASDGLVIALGITIDGKKVILGLEQMNSENSRSIAQFFNKLIERGFVYQKTTYTEAKTALDKIHSELTHINPSS